MLIECKGEYFYWLIVNKIYNGKRSDPKHWDNIVNLEGERKSSIFKSVRGICKENSERISL